MGSTSEAALGASDSEKQEDALLGLWGRGGLCKCLTGHGDQKG